MIIMIKFMQSGSSGIILISIQGIKKGAGRFVSHSDVTCQCQSNNNYIYTTYTYVVKFISIFPFSIFYAPILSHFRIVRRLVKGSWPLRELMICLYNVLVRIDYYYHWEKRTQRKTTKFMYMDCCLLFM